MKEALSGQSSWASAPARPALAEGEVHLWRAWLTASDGQLAHLRERLNAEERARVDRFIFPEHRRRFLIARVVLRDVLARYAGRAPQDLTFETAPGGKPYLVAGAAGTQYCPKESFVSPPRASPPCAEEIRFNMTHSADLMLLAVTARRELGVDVEQVRERVACDRLAERYFAPQEAGELRLLPEGERRAAFFRCWTRKEAYIKALGKGLALPLRSFFVPVRADSPMRITSAAEPGGIASWTLHNLEPAEGYVGALVAEGPVTALCRYEWNEG